MHSAISGDENDVHALWGRMLNYLCYVAKAPLCCMLRLSFITFHYSIPMCMFSTVGGGTESGV